MLQIDGPLVFVSDSDGALETVLKKGAPSLSAEAQTALQVGKKLKQAKLIIAIGGDTWAFTFDAENFCFKSMKLPDGEALEAHSKFQERVQFLHELQQLFLALFVELASQLKDSEKRQKLQKEVKDWVKNRNYINE